MKQTLAVVFGGKSCEHDISVITGLQLMENIDRNKYDVLPVYIDGDGRWFTGEKLLSAAFYTEFDEKAVTPVYVNTSTGELVEQTAKTGLFAKAPEKRHIDCVIPAMHGLNGEDGSLAGLFQLAGVPLASSGVLGGSVGMDKILMKAAFRGAGLPVLDYVYFDRGEFAADPERILDRIEAAVPYPVFIKPANLGSSIGISKAHDRSELRHAVEVASYYDRRILAERGVNELMEVNCSAVGYGSEVDTSVCEQPVTWEEFLSFDDKYIGGGKNAPVKGGKSGGKGGMTNLSRIIPAPIGDELTARVRAMTAKAFRLLDCRGVVRIDYIIDKADGSLYINEINTIPGSFAFYLWEPLGVRYSDLIDRIVDCGLKAYADSRANQYSYDSKVLKSYSGKGTKG
ncbi:MAG: D-alanine--D-alanine ligase [Eubacteriales bacterium]|nr:D-alanine--D-alanine ligase [Eubacteriales bacterium]